MAKRTVVSVSVSSRNPEAVTVAQALAVRGIPLTHGGSQILAWAAAYLTGQPPEALEEEAAAAALGMSVEEIDALFDAF